MIGPVKNRQMSNDSEFSKMMRAVLFENHQIRIRNVPVPVPVPEEALVKIELAGICATDVALLNGYHDFSGIPGHEFVGRVVSAPERPALEGCRVVADINCSCGRCDVCRSGNYRHCENRTVLGIRGRSGVFAEYCAIPAANLRPVPETVGSEEAVFAEPLAAAMAVGRQLNIAPNSRMAVLGDGKIGLLCALWLRGKTENLVLIGRHPEKLAIAAAQGVETICNASASVNEHLGQSFDGVIEATGRPDGINQALSLVCPMGTVVVKTTVHEPSVIDLADLVVREVRLAGSRCGDIRQALEFMKVKKIRLSSLVEAVYPVEEFEAAFSRSRHPGSRKVLIRMPE